MTVRENKIFVISGPSGAGKSTLCDKALKAFSNLKFSISYTTREIRQAEVDGVDYHFISDSEFDKMIDKGEFAEYATVHGKKYGTARKTLEEMLGSGLNPILDVDIQGAETLRGSIDNGVFIFLLPPSIEECEKRIFKRDRGDTEDEIRGRLKVALEEIKEAPKYDYIIINDHLDNSFALFKDILEGSPDAENSNKNNMLERVKLSFIL